MFLFSYFCHDIEILILADFKPFTNWNYKFDFIRKCQILILADVGAAKLFQVWLMLKCLFRPVACSRVTQIKSCWADSNGYNSENMHFWPQVGEVKMSIRGYIYFENCKQTAENCKQTAEKSK